MAAPRKTPGEVIVEVLDLDGKRVADVGCGAGGIARAMAAAGAIVTGIDPSERAIAEAAEAGPAAGVTFLRGGGEDLPLDDESQDIVVYNNSLHHVPVEHHARALEREAARVLRPGGLLYLVEPLAEGPRFELARLVHDEGPVRERAYAAIKKAAAGGFAEEREFVFMAENCFDDFDDFRDRQTARHADRRRAFEARGDALREAFERLSSRRDGRYCFDQPMRVNLLRKRD